jgi:hypothetical protein
MVLSLLLHAACSDYSVLGRPDPGQGSPDGGEGHDGGSGSDSATRDSADLGVDVCPDTAPADREIPATVSCIAATNPFSGELVERARYAQEGRDGARWLWAARFSDGNGDGRIGGDDQMQLVVWLGGASVDYGVIMTAEGATLYSWTEPLHLGGVATGDIWAGDPGSEAVHSGYDRSSHDARVTVVSETGVASTSSLTFQQTVQPWLTDLEGDGRAEVLLGANVVDPFGGRVQATLEGFESDGNVYYSTISADLDRDGVEEIIAGGGDGGSGLALFAPDGTRLATCREGDREWSAGDIAVGNLDDDADGEFIAAGLGFVALCDADGALISETDIGTEEPNVVSIGQLDADGAVEFLVSDWWGLTALDTDLTVLWTFRTRPYWVWYPHSLADLDGDGVHEVLVNAATGFLVLDARGRVLSLDPPGRTGNTSWKGIPVVADLDADGLAEIVLPGWEVVVLTSPEGGWPVLQANRDWPGLGAHPGDRTESGELPGPIDWWNEPNHNVWNGRPAVPVGRPELSVALTELCVESCDGDSVVTVEVGNPTEAPVSGDVSVELYSVDTAALLASTTLSASPAVTTATSVSFRVSTASIRNGYRVVVDGADSVLECDLRTNTTEQLDPFCE